MDNILYPYILVNNFTHSSNLIWYSKTIKAGIGDTYIDFNLKMTNKNYKIYDTLHAVYRNELREIEYIETLDYDVYKVIAQDVNNFLLDVPFIDFCSEYSVNMEKVTAIDLITQGNWTDYGDYKVYTIPQTFIFKDNTWYIKDISIDKVESIEIETNNDNFVGHYDKGKFFIKVKKVNLHGD